MCLKIEEPIRHDDPFGSDRVLSSINNHKEVTLNFRDTAERDDSFIESFYNSEEKVDMPLKCGRVYQKLKNR